MWVCWIEKRKLGLDHLVFDGFSTPALKKSERERERERYR